MHNKIAPSQLSLILEESLDTLPVQAEVEVSVLQVTAKILIFPSIKLEEELSFRERVMRDLIRTHGVIPH